MDPNNEDQDLSKLDRGDALPGVQDELPLDEPETETPPEPETESPKEDAPKTEEADEVTPKAEEPAKPKPKIQIPKERLDEEIRKRRQLEQEVAALREKVESIAKPKADDAPPPDPKTVEGTQEWFDTQEEAYMDAVLDGKNKEALEIRRQIRAAEERKFEEKVNTRSRQALKEVDIETENANAITQLEGAFAVFNPTSAEFDEDLVNAVLGARAAIMKRDPNKMPGAALIEAAAKLGFALGKQAPAPAAEDETETEEEDVVATAPAASVAQPARSGASAPPKTKPRLTEATVSKMSPADLARARGDIL